MKVLNKKDPAAEKAKREKDARNFYNNNEKQEHMAELNELRRKRDMAERMKAEEDEMKAERLAA